MDFFFFTDAATTEIYTLSLHDALPIYAGRSACGSADRHLRRPVAGAARAEPAQGAGGSLSDLRRAAARRHARSEEHTSELQSQSNLVCRLLLEKKKQKDSYSLISHNST